MKVVWISNETPMVLQDSSNIDPNHKLYDTFYEKEVNDNYHVHVCDDACVYDRAEVYGNAIVYDRAEILDNARVFNNAQVFGNAIVYDFARIFENARVSGNAIVSGSPKIYGNAIVYNDVEVEGSARVTGNAVATKRVINIVGLPYNVTLTDQHIQIGCKQFTFEHAKKLAERNIDNEHLDFKIMIKYKDLLLELIKVKEQEQ